MGVGAGARGENKHTHYKHSHPYGSSFRNLIFGSTEAASIGDSAASIGEAPVEPINSFLELVNSQSISAKKEKELNIIRFEPSFKFTSDTQRKNVVQNVLMPYHRAHCSGMHFAYTNYHSLNFFTASLVPS